jgi:hypothetical protein
MSASRNGVTGACCTARFWLSAFCAALSPTSIGYQDLAALLARERAAPSHWHLIISPVQAATFSYSRPIGSAIPEPLGFQTVNFDPRSLDAYSWKIDEPLHVLRPGHQIEYPSVDRRHKANRLPSRVMPAAPVKKPTPELPVPAAAAGAQAEQTPRASRVAPGLAAPSLAEPIAAASNPAAPNPGAQSHDAAGNARPAAPIAAASSLATPSLAEPIAAASNPAAPNPAAPNPAAQSRDAADNAPPAAPATDAAAVSQTDAHQENVALAPAASAAKPAAPAVEAAAPVVPTPPAIVAPPQAEPVPLQTKMATASDEDDVALVDKPPEIPPPGETENGPPSLGSMSFLDADTADRSIAIYFGGGVMGSPSRLQSWAPGAEPILVPPSAELAEQSVDTNIKLSALEDTGNDTGSGESIAGKDDGSRLQTPAQRLGLEGNERAKAEKCLADAVYFEARGEVRKGQEAVAQVVMNRVFSGYYPHDVCGVVYQNAHRHLACQFTFACEGKDLNRIDEPDMWEQAKSIAKDTLDGKIWLAEVGHATHYHAYWVHPSWVHEMTRLFKLGVHTFYRPRNWGDGEGEPVWGKIAPAAPSTSNNDAPPGKPEAAKPDAKAPQATASPAGTRT